MIAQRHQLILITLLLSMLIPIAGCGPKPEHNANWYYYWEKDHIVSDLNRSGSPFSRWDWNVQAANQNVYGAAHGPSNGFVLTNLCITSHNSYSIYVEYRGNPSRFYYIGASTQYGIQQVAATSAHEKQHIVNYKLIQQPGEKDTDGFLGWSGDGLADSQENRAPYWFIIGDRDTYQLALYIHPVYAAYGDNEFVARQAEQAGVNAVDMTKDWSKGGAQWKH